MRASERVRGRYCCGVVVAVESAAGWPDGERSWVDMDGRASERGFGSRVGEGGGDGEAVMV